MCGPGMSARDQKDMALPGKAGGHGAICSGLLLLVAVGLGMVAMCPPDNLCCITAVLPMGKGHKKMLNAVKWQSWDFNQGLAAQPKLGFHTARWWHSKAQKNGAI